MNKECLSDFKVVGDAKSRLVFALQNVLAVEMGGRGGKESVGEESAAGPGRRGST